MSEGAPSREEIEEEEAESDAEAAESEWHAWLAGIIIVGGLALIVAPDRLVPELILGLGPIIIALGIVGWVIQWSYKKFR